MITRKIAKKVEKNKKPAAKKKVEKDLDVTAQNGDDDFFIPLADGIPVHCAHDKIISLDKIRLYSKNANDHPPKQVSLLATLIDEHGWRGPITISNQSGFVVRGHGRYAAAKKLQSKEVPVDYQDYESEALERADRLADNKIQELSEWNRELLKEELIDLDSGILPNMDLTGFDQLALEDLMTAAPPPDLKSDDDSGRQSDPVKPKTFICPKCGHKWDDN